jgi:hypothetical protein
VQKVGEKERKKREKCLLEIKHVVNKIMNVD